VEEARAPSARQRVSSPGRALWVSLRPAQWTKNLLIFAALIFSQNLFNGAMVAKTVAGFFLFCAVSSGVYLLNDIYDLESDRLHPTKRYRPLAAGELSVATARRTSLLLMGSGLLGSLLLAPAFGAAAAAYLAIQLAYIWRLKETVILDVFCVATGFVIRAAAGGLVIAVPISSWLIVCAIMLSLFLALAKRRHELTLLAQEAPGHRPSLKEYSPALLDQMIAVVTASTLMSYTLYTLSDVTIEKFGSDNLKYTIPFVLYGILRYLYLVHRRQMGGEPERALLTDKPLLLTILLYGIAVTIILYF
jgi:4-hydroxybenzoate polyprenyltransferase